MSEVKPADQTLKKLIEAGLDRVTIDLQKPQKYKLTFNEHRNTLQDSQFNFMDLAEPIEIDFLNVEEIKIES